MAKNRRNTNKVLPNGRSAYDSAQYLQLTHKLLKSPNFRALKGSSVKILLEIAACFNGRNNGKIIMSYAQLAENLNLGRQTIYNGLLELQKAGFLVMHYHGHFTGRQASEWEVTFLPIEGHPPSNLWGRTPVAQNKGNKKIERRGFLAETLLMLKNEKLND